MQTTSLMEQGLTLMLAGMGTVFVFLTTLVIAMSLMSAVAGRFRPEDGDTSGASEAEVAAISAAIARHRQS